MALNATQFPPSQIYSLSSKTAVITGGTRGLGLNCASGLMLAGCSTIIITSRKANACEKAKRELEDCVPADRKGSVRVFAFSADLSRFEEVERFVKEVDGVVGKTGVDILVANAGATWGEKFDTHPDSAIAKVFDLNVRSVFNLIRLMTPLLILAASPASPSRVITISSIAGIIPGTTNSNSSTFGYSASKAAVIHLTKNLALELGPRNILVNSIAPGFFVTKMAEGLINSQGGEGKLGKMTPNGRLGKGEDIAGVAVFLSSPASSHINGAVIPLDGGRHLDTRAMGRGGEDVAKL